MLTANMSRIADGAASTLTLLKVGKATESADPSSDRVVIVSENDQPILRVDVYAYGPDCFVFEEALIWHDLLIVGFGGHTGNYEHFLATLRNGT